MQKEDRERMDEGRGGWVMFEERCEEMVAVVVSNKKEIGPTNQANLKSRLEINIFGKELEQVVDVYILHEQDGIKAPVVFARNDFVFFISRL